MSINPSNRAADRTHVPGIGPIEHETDIKDGKISSLSLKTPGKNTEIKLNTSGGLTDLTITSGLGNKPVHIHFNEDKNHPVDVTVEGKTASKDIAKHALHAAKLLMQHPAYVKGLANNLEGGAPAAHSAVRHAIDAMNNADTQLAVPSSATGRPYRGLLLRSDPSASLDSPKPQAHLAPDHELGNKPHPHAAIKAPDAAATQQAHKHHIGGMRNA
jgi:hypothetical protein